MSLALLVYRLGTRLLEPLAPRLLDARVKQGKEDGVRVDERLGIPGLARPDGDLVWLHGISVGETLSLLPVVERFRKARLSYERGVSLRYGRGRLEAFARSAARP